MRLLGLVLALLSAAPLAARRTWFVDKGVAYHIGDDRYSRSEDALFMQGKGVVGTRWEQRFRVDRPDKVRVRILQVRGVDDCPYCKIIISINNKPMARLYAEDNQREFTTPDPLAVAVQPGRVHVLSIESVGNETVDDFVIQDVIVETAEAGVELLPGPRVFSPSAPPPAPPVRAEGGCGRGSLQRGWLNNSGVQLAGSSPLHLGGRSLAPGQGAALEIRVQQVAALDPVGQALEIRLGSGLGWTLNLAPGEDRVVHANILGPGGHRQRRWDASAWRPGQWNRLELRRCMDGSSRLFLNGQAAGSTQAGAASGLDLGVEIRGLQAEIREPGPE